MATTSTIRDLLEKAKPNPVEREATRVVTVRMPCSLHEALRELSYLRRQSMNVICVEALQAQSLLSLDLIEADGRHPDAVECH